MLGWMSHKLESRLLGEIATSDKMISHSNGRKWRGTKEPLDKKKLQINVYSKKNGNS